MKTWTKRIGFGLAVLLLAIIAWATLVSPDQLSGDSAQHDEGISTASVADTAAFAESAGIADRASSDVVALEKAVAPTPRDVITTGTFQIEAKDPGAIASDLQAWVGKNGGFVDHMNISNAKYDEHGKIIVQPHAYITLRLADYTELKKYFSENDLRVLEEAIGKEDVTEQLVDIDARIKALEVSVDRLTEFLSTATKYQDIFQIERELTARQGQLDSLRSQQKTLKEQVALNTIEVEIHTPASAKNLTEDSEKSFKEGLLTGWNSFVGFLAALGFGLAVSAAWLLLFAPLALLVWVFVKRRKNANKDKKGNEAPAAATE